MHNGKNMSTDSHLYIPLLTVHKERVRYRKTLEGWTFRNYEVYIFNCLMRFNPLVPDAAPRQTSLFAIQTIWSQPIINWRIFIFCIPGTNGLTAVTIARQYKLCSFRLSFLCKSSLKFQSAHRLEIFSTFTLSLVCWNCHHGLTNYMCHRLFSLWNWLLAGV